MSSPFYILRKIPFTKKVMTDQYKKRAAQIIKRISPFIGKNEKILDIGTGTGFVVAGLGKKTKAAITGLDVKLNPLNESGNVVIYDGKHIPFKNNSFDSVLLLTVLHHCKHPLQVLDEAKRVSAKKIIIMEDLFNSPIEKGITFVEDSIVNWEFRNHPHSNRDEQGWLTVFKKKRLKVVDFQKFHLICAGFPFRIGIFVLEKK